MGEGRLIEVYRAKDSQQAHVLRTALEDAGIRALVEGELLQGALGGVPVGWSSDPRVLVEETDAVRARRLVEEWESKGASDEAE